MKIFYLLFFISLISIGLSQSFDSQSERLERDNFIRKLLNDLNSKEVKANAKQQRNPKMLKADQSIKESSSLNKVEETTSPASEKDAITDKIKQTTNSAANTISSKEENSKSTQSDTQSTESTNIKQTEVDIKLIRSEIEKYQILDKKSYSELCSDKLLDKKFLKTIHLSDNNFILNLDEYNLTFKFQLNDKDFYPKLSKLPYRCTSFCQSKSKNESKSNYTTINRFKYNKYLVELLGSKEFTKITLYYENIKFLESESEQDQHLIESLVFTIQRDGCTPPIGNPKLLDIHFDNPVTNDLIRIFCNDKQMRNKFIDNEEFLIQEFEQNDPMYKHRNVVFFTYPVITLFSLNNETSKDFEGEKNNLANTVKDISNAVQLKDKDDQEKYIVFNSQQMFILKKEKTQFVALPPSYSIQNYYSCPEPLCLDPYFDAIFIVKTCDFDQLFDFLPKSSKLLVAFRGNYFYLISKADQMKAPKIEQAIPIDYLFKEVLKRPDIDFNYLNAAEYVKKSDVVILFKDDKYLLIDPTSKNVHGPFNISETFKYSKGNPGMFYNGY